MQTPPPDDLPLLRAIWARLNNAQRRFAMTVCPPEFMFEVLCEPWDALRPEQRPPSGDWAIWALLAGRGFGKTRAGADWVIGLAGLPETRIALIGANLDAARQVMVEGETGLLARGGGSLVFEPSRRRLAWPNGSEARLFSGSDADSLRGPQFHAAWGDEAAHWSEGEAVLTNLRMGLRLGEHPRLLLTTTPRPRAWLKALIAEPGVVVTRGRTHDNTANLPQLFINAMIRRYRGTLIGRQELDGELIEDLAGALWTRRLIEACRVTAAPPLGRVVIGVDPPAGAERGVCGIVVAGLTGRGDAVVLADASVGGIGPNGWGRAVVEAYGRHEADMVIVEVNNGGDMVAAILKSISATLPVVPVRASRGKVARAEPVASLYREGRVNHAGTFVDLEDQLCGLLESGVYAGPGASPDRADALVWALTALLLGPGPVRPGVRTI